jgi:uncharacterized membrane protein
MNKRPITVTILACVLIATGVASLTFHVPDFKASHSLLSGFVLPSLVRILAIVSGVFLLRGSNWARWLALAWIAFHVAISFFDSLQKVAVHSLIFLLFGYLLLRPEATAYFHRRRKNES